MLPRARLSIAGPIRLTPILPRENWHLLTVSESTPPEYNNAVEQAVEFIRSGSSQSVDRMEAEMNEAAENLEFEKAAMLRDRINAVKKAAEKQKIINSGVDSADIIGIYEYHIINHLSFL